MSSNNTTDSDSDTSSNSSSSTEEEMITLLLMLPRPKVYRKRNNPFEIYDDVDFKWRFRFSKSAVQEIMNIFDIHSLEVMCERNQPISPLNQLLITLRYYATGTFQQVLGDHINIHKSTVSRIIPRITEKIARHATEFIHMPKTRNEVLETVSSFYNIKQFPKVIGAIDCTHIKIMSPGGNNAELFRNRKGWFSINVQAVCSANLKIMDIVARWPGSVHDSTIFNSSFLRAQFEMGQFPDSWLLGDNGYACKPYLLTPLLNPVSPSELRYNNAHISTRNTIERTFGMWKRRFACLSVGMNLKPSKVIDIIVATAVLHNLAIFLKDETIDIDIEDNSFHNFIDEQMMQENNTSARTVLINTLFTR